jgi:predicted RNA-binding protein with PUA-like domain
MEQSGRHWLMKSEPDEFSIDDLRREGRAPWTGVRNYQARNFMRDGMRVGDPVLFYHSSTQPAGVAGLARVASGALPDPTQFDRRSPYFEPRATREKPVWMMVEVAFVEKFPALITLEELKAERRMEGLALLQKGSRLSIQPVSPAHFAWIAQRGRRA